MLENKVLVFFGKISYSLYLWNIVFLANMPMAPEFIQLIVGQWYSVVFAILVSYLSWKYIENPFRNLHQVRKAG